MFDMDGVTKEQHLYEIGEILIRSLFKDIPNQPDLEITISDLSPYIKRNYSNIKKTAAQIYQDKNHVLH